MASQFVYGLIHPWGSVSGLSLFWYSYRGLLSSKNEFSVFRIAINLLLFLSDFGGFCSKLALGKVASSIIHSQVLLTLACETFTCWHLSHSCRSLHTHTHTHTHTHIHTGSNRLFASPLPSENSPKNFWNSRFAPMKGRFTHSFLSNYNIIIIVVVVVDSKRGLWHQLLLLLWCWCCQILRNLIEV